MVIKYSYPRIFKASNAIRALAAQNDGCAAKWRQLDSILEALRSGFQGKPAEAVYRFVNEYERTNVTVEHTNKILETIATVLMEAARRNWDVDTRTAREIHDMMLESEWNLMSLLGEAQLDNPT